MGWFRRTKPAAQPPPHQSRMKPIMDAHKAGLIDDRTAGALAFHLGDLRPWMYDATGRCKHLGPYPGCRGGCNRFRHLFGGDES